MDMFDIGNDFNETLQYESNHITDEMVEDSYYGDYAEYAKTNYSLISGEIALWRAVLLQYLIDLKIKSNNTKYNSTKNNAYKWFMDKDNVEDVKTVCKYAGYEYRKVMSIAKDIISGHDHFNV